MYMRNVQTSLNEDEYKKFSEVCRKVGESEYTFIKKAIAKRMAETNSILARADRWILDGKSI